MISSDGSYIFLFYYTCMSLVTDEENKSGVSSVAW